jgi:hypothetical protein
MALRDEIVNFIDGNGLVAPNLVSPGTVKGSDNGPMFTSEYYVMLQKLGQLNSADCADFARLIGQCIDPENMLCRVPVGQDDGQEGPDDYYGVLNGCKQLKNTDIPRRFLKAVFKYKGSLDNEDPGKWQWSAVLIRQPQLLAAMISAAFPSWLNPLHILIRTLAFPLYLVAAVSIFISCINTPASSADPRRLSWHLLQTVCPVSLMCKFASLFWYHRLYSVYGQAGMKGVAKQYYKNNHPFICYWVSE